MKAEINYRSIAKVLGELLIAEGCLLLIPLAVEILDREPSWPGFAIAASLALALGYLMQLPVRKHYMEIRRREGYLLVSCSWVLFSLVGMIPFLMAVNPLSPADAFFETISGFTTTGATTIADVEALSKGVLLWRSMTQWIGGLGIILFILALLPQLNFWGGIPMYNAETTGITHDKLHPRIRHTASTLWSVYIVLTLLCFILLWAGPMDFYDALCHAMTAISTGGFSTKNVSIAYWNSNYINIVLTLFMLIGGVSFSLLYGAWRGRWRTLFSNDVLKAYILIILTAYLFTAASLYFNGNALSLNQLIVQPLFHVVSDITTTGFSLADYSQWGPLSLLVTILLMISGACAGSTSGAVKVDRLVAISKQILNEMKKAVYPKRIYSVRVNGTVINEDAMSRMMGFMGLYAILSALGTILLCCFGIPFTDSLFASLSCIGNNGLGYGLTGAEGGFHLLPDATKWAMSWLMLAGRLELYSMVVFLFPVFWRTK